MDVLQNKIVTIRKSHHCWGCGKNFSAGSKLRKYVAVDNGEFQQSYYCPDCDKRFSEIDSYRYEDGLAFGELKQIHDDYYGGLNA